MTTEIIQSKSFHHNLITLQLEYEVELEVWHINIHTSYNPNISIFGIFTTLESAKAKFDTISL